MRAYYAADAMPPKQTQRRSSGWSSPLYSKHTHTTCPGMSGNSWIFMALCFIIIFISMPGSSSPTKLWHCRALTVEHKKTFAYMCTVARYYFKQLLTYYCAELTWRQIKSIRLDWRRFWWAHSTEYCLRMWEVTGLGVSVPGEEGKRFTVNPRYN